MLLIKNLRKNSKYGKVLFLFASVFYKESTFTHQAAAENLSSILTPSDKAFLLLLIVVYYEETSDADYVTQHPDKIFIDCKGWQQDGIDLYNKLYIKVREDRAKNGQTFDTDFRALVNNSINGNETIAKRKPKKFTLSNE